MALSQKGARYDYRDHLTDPHVKGAVDDVASQVASIRQQGGFGERGTPSAPTAPSGLAATVAASIFTVLVLDKNPAPGVRYRLQWSTTPNFANPIEEELATTTWQRQLIGQTLYFRVASKLLASPVSEWVYFGSAAAPIAVQG